MGRCFGAVFPDQGYRNVDVMVAVLARAVVDRRPPALGFSAGRSEAHGVHEIIRDVAPLLVRQRPFFGAQTQRAMPHGGVLVADVDALLLGRVPGEIPDLHGDAEQLPWLIKVLGDGEGIRVVQDAVVVPTHHGRITGNEVRIGVRVLRLVRVR